MTISPGGSTGMLLLTLMLTGCGEEPPCEALAAVCEACPSDGNSNGLVARESCYDTVESNDELACEDRLDQRTYQSFGCVAD